MHLLISLARSARHQVPQLVRSDVVLPGAVLGRVERHAMGIAAHRDALLGAGQHLKRGLLLYGPPGTGKTHTMRYLVGQMGAYTRFVLTGRSLHAIGTIADLDIDADGRVDSIVLAGGGTVPGARLRAVGNYAAVLANELPPPTGPLLPAGGSRGG